MMDLPHLLFFIVYAIYYKFHDPLSRSFFFMCSRRRPPARRAGHSRLRPSRLIEKGSSIVMEKYYTRACLSVTIKWILKIEKEKRICKGSSIWSRIVNLFSFFPRFLAHTLLCPSAKRPILLNIGISEKNDDSVAGGPSSL